MSQSGGSVNSFRAGLWFCFVVMALGTIAAIQVI